MEKIKVNPGDMFGGMSGVSLKGTSLNSRNISNYDLVVTWDSDEQTVYKIRRDDKFVIDYDKKTGEVDWYDDNWRDEGFDGYPNEYYEKDRDYWIEKFNKK